MLHLKLIFFCTKESVYKWLFICAYINLKKVISGILTSPALDNATVVGNSCNENLNERGVVLLLWAKLEG